MRPCGHIALVWLLLAYTPHISASETSGTSLCPTHCSCAFERFLTALTLVCAQTVRTTGVAGVDHAGADALSTPRPPCSDSLLREIDALLADNSQLTNLTISGESGEIQGLDDAARCAALGRFSEEICNLSRLVSLRLEGTRLAALPDNCLSRLSQLRVLAVTHTDVTHLQDGLFDGLLQLEELHLSNNKIETIGLRVFSHPSALPRLKVIALDHNRLTSLEPWPMIRALASPGLTVDVRFNHISTFTNIAGWTYHCNQTIIHMILDLSHNHIGHLSAFFDVYFTSISALLCFTLGSRKSKVVFESNQLICDCLDFNMYAVFSTFPHSSGFVHGNQCINRLSKVNGSDTRNISLKDLVCDVAERCPVKCRCFKQPYNSTFHVLCAGLGLNQVPLVIPPANVPYTMLMPAKIPMYKLDFSRNHISVLDARSYFNNTSILDLSNSQLENISEEALVGLQKVDRIYLHDNQLRMLPRSVEAINFSFTSLSLYNNPLDCSCDQRWLKQWLNTVRDRLENADVILCSTPARLRGKSIWSVSETDFCYMPSPYKLDPKALAFITLASVVSVICLSLFLVILRFRVQTYKWFRFHPFDRNEGMVEEMNYDVFLLFAPADIKLALDILSLLEKNGCKVCFNQRDFMPGTGVNENILEADRTSKRVLCLLSRHFIASKYCLLEFTIAQTHNQNHRRLIILKHEDFDAVIGAEPDGDEQMAPDIPLLAASAEDSAKVLREFVSRHTYIDLSAAAWRDQLLYAMPINRLGADCQGN